MKTKLFLLLFFSCSTVVLRADQDSFAAIRTALDQNQLEAAETALAPLVAIEKPDGRAWFYLSQLRSRQKRTNEAIQPAENAVTADPDRAEYQSNLGRILGQRAGEVSFMQRAFLAHPMLAAFKKSVALDPEHIPGYVGLSQYYTYAPAIAGGGRETAERYAHELEKRDPVLGTTELANIAEHFNDPVQAYALYTKASVAQSNAAWIQEALGRLSEKLHQPAEAKAHYEKAIAIEPARTSVQEALTRLASVNR
jgi:tetratricopeptide (TPR) repeat protein